MKTKLHAICDSQGRPLDLFTTAGQVSYYIGVRALLSGLPNVRWLLGNRGYDADWLRDRLHDMGIRAYISDRKHRKTPVKYDKATLQAAKLYRKKAQESEARGNAIRQMFKDLSLGRQHVR